MDMDALLDSIPKLEASCMCKCYRGPLLLQDGRINAVQLHQTLQLGTSKYLKVNNIWTWRQ